MNSRRSPAALLLCILLTGSAAWATSPEELVIFTQVTNSPASQHFTEVHLPALVQAAEELGLPVRILNAADGAPAEVRITPLVVYQNYRGRSIFQGRTKDASKLTHFIRTSRAVPPTNLEAEFEQVPVLERGRSRTATPLKITALRGTTPPGHDAAVFEEQARKAIVAGFEQLKRRDKVTLGPSDRQFYMDFHPHLSEGGELSISTTLFSQFHCIDPIYQNWVAPTQGPWQEWEKVFAQAARGLEEEMLRQMRESSIGDGFDPLPAEVASKSWEELDLALPPRPSSGVEVHGDIELGADWRIEEPQGDEPRLIFRFPAPLERYTGEVEKIRGELHLAEDLTLATARGFIEAVTSSVTMGEDSLDKALRGKMLTVDRFPSARFELQGIPGDLPPLAFGRASQFVTRGEFEMMGVKKEIEVRGEIEPVIGEDGAPRLRVTASFRIPLMTPFGIEGPDGPAPANDTLIFYLDFLMIEA